MEVHQLRYFLAVAEERSFSRAAEKVHVAQPSLSQQIQKLESEVGVPLFDRLNRRVTLTEAGTALLPFAKRILNELRDARRSLDDHHGSAGGTVRLGIIPTIAPFIVQTLFAECRARFPQVSLQVVEDVTENLFDAAERGEIDFGILSTCRKAQSLHVELITTEPLVVALPTKHKLATQKTLVWNQLKEERVLTLPESHCLSVQVTRACRAKGITVVTDFPLLQLSTLLGIVAAGDGISLVPRMAAENSNSECMFIPFKASPPARELNFLRNASRYQSKAAGHVAALARDLLISKIGLRRPPGRSSEACELET